MPAARGMASWPHFPRKLAAALLACGLCGAGVASPAPAGASGPSPTSVGRQAVAGAVTSAATPAQLAIEPQVCSMCLPPLIYRGGPVMSTGTAAGLTVTPIFWEPVGGRYAFPPKYESIIDGYVQNVAAASGSDANVYSVDTEYYDVTDNVPAFIKYNIDAGGPVVDTDRFPANGCQPAPGYRACITDLQLRSELTLITTNLDLPTDLAHVYPVFFPPGVETVDVDGSNSYDGFCGYHRAFGTDTAKTIYADVPYEANGCSAGQAPNGDLAADGAVSTLSHELNDAITDPLEFDHAWIDLGGNEIADMCDQVYGRPLGSTNPSNPAGSEYNQVINGGTYYIQEMFSNTAYEKYGPGQGCTLSEALVANLDADGLGTEPTNVRSTFATATPDVLPADAKATSTIVVTATDGLGDAVAGDHVYFSTGLKSGTGVCGRLSQTEATTGANGAATVTYRASGWNVSCWVVAVEADGGRAAESVVYQGTTQKDVPVLAAKFPTLLKAGASPTIFTLRFGNASSASHAVRPVGLSRPGRYAQFPEGRRPAGAPVLFDERPQRPFHQRCARRYDGRRRRHRRSPRLGARLDAATGVFKDGHLPGRPRLGRSRVQRRTAHRVYGLPGRGQQRLGFALDPGSYPRRKCQRAYGRPQQHDVVRAYRGGGVVGAAGGHVDPPLAEAPAA